MLLLLSMVLPAYGVQAQVDDEARVIRIRDDYPMDNDGDGDPESLRVDLVVHFNRTGYYYFNTVLELNTTYLSDITTMALPRKSLSRFPSPM